MPEGSTEGSAVDAADGPRDTSMGNDSFVAIDGNEAGLDTAVSPDADAAGEGQADADAQANASVDCGCGNAHATSSSCTDAGTCQFVCNSGWGNCDASPPNTYGCETPTNTPSNCGGCGQACDTDASTGASCNGNTCTYGGCKPGWADCVTAAPDTNGCETPIDGSSCSVCPGMSSCDTTSGHSNGAHCEAGTCLYASCAPGWADCNPTPPDTHGCDTPLSSVFNCTGCGRACDMTTGTPACDGGTCSYSCSTGRSDCNAGTPPNLDGCECPTAGCCSSACQTTHGNGVGQNFYDCVKQGQIDQIQATKACTAFTGSSSQCTASSTGAILVCGILGTASSVCSSGATTCYCWEYSGINAGRVQSVSGTCTAVCGSGSDPTWN